MHDVQAATNNIIDWLSAVPYVTLDQLISWIGHAASREGLAPKVIWHELTGYVEFDISSTEARLIA